MLSEKSEGVALPICADLHLKENRQVAALCFSEYAAAANAKC